LDSSGGWFCAAEILPLQDDVGEEQGEGYAGPDDCFGDGLAQIFPACASGDHPYFQKDDGDGEAADHPLAVRSGQAEASFVRSAQGKLRAQKREKRKGRLADN